MRLQGGGSKHIPDEIKRVKGTLGKKGEREIVKGQAFTGYFEPPSHVKEAPHAEAVWKVTLPMLQDMGVMTAADLDALCTYCIAVGIHRQAAMQIGKNGITLTSKKITGEDMDRKVPEIDILNSQAKIIQSFAGEFGLTPSSRARLNVTISKEADPLAEFLPN